MPGHLIIEPGADLCRVGAVRLLLDTHAMYWYIEDDPQLSGPAIDPGYIEGNRLPPWASKMPADTESSLFQFSCIHSMKKDFTCYYRPTRDNNTYNGGGTLAEDSDK
jgi:hypothetical protein